MFVAIAVFIAMLLLLVLVHEWGHFIVAKKAGCTVEEFGFGFPPRLFSWQRGGTRFSLNLLPIGGFVKIEGENMDERGAGPKSFASKSAGRRVAILAAGVAMNVILAWVLFTIQAGIGTPTIADGAQAGLADIHTYIMSVAPSSPAQEVGIAPLDRVVRIADVVDPTVSQVQETIAQFAGQSVVVEVERAGKHLTFTTTPRLHPPPEQGSLGVSLLASGLSRVPWWQAPWAGLVKTGRVLVVMVEQFWLFISKLFASGAVSEQLTGPIGIAVYSGEATRMGVPYVLEFAALISLNLAVINILPFPALDGGRILFVLWEVLTGRRASFAVESWAHTTGFALLIVLMILITLKDIRHYF